MRIKMLPRCWQDCYSLQLNIFDEFFLISNQFSLLFHFLYQIYNMEDYERKKLYRVHLKNISQIKNCQAAFPSNAYSSRLYNYNTLTSSFKPKPMKSLNHSSSSFKLNNHKKSQQKKVTDYYTQKQNERLQKRLLRTSASINMIKYQRDYEEHRKILKLHTKVKNYKRDIFYKIYDITFKCIPTNLKEEFVIYDNSEGKDNQYQLFRGNIFELRKSIIKGYRDQKIMLKIVGRKEGTATIVNEQKMVPIMFKKEIVGTLILEVC